MNYNERLNIVVASDENYAPHLVTLLVSIGENNKYEEQIQISIFDGGLSKKTKEWIFALSNRYSNILFSFLQMTEKDIEEKLGGGLDETVLLQRIHEFLSQKRLRMIKLST